jgi:hypothetical protein
MIRNANRRIGAESFWRSHPRDTDPPVGCLSLALAASARQCRTVVLAPANCGHPLQR